MKNSAVHAMISNQFPQVELCDIRVIFEASIGGIEEYDISIVEDMKVRKFKLNLELVETTEIAPKVFERGVRVVAKSTAGFHAGARGVIEFVEPSGNRVWVIRDGASGSCWYKPDELDFEDSK